MPGQVRRSDGADRQAVWRTQRPTASVGAGFDPQSQSATDTTLLPGISGVGKKAAWTCDPSRPRSRPDLPRPPLRASSTLTRTGCSSPAVCAKAGRDKLFAFCGSSGICYRRKMLSFFGVPCPSDPRYALISFENRSPDATRAHRPREHGRHVLRGHALRIVLGLIGASRIRYMSPGRFPGRSFPGGARSRPATSCRSFGLPSKAEYLVRDGQIRRGSRVLCVPPARP